MHALMTTILRTPVCFMRSRVLRVLEFGSSLVEFAAALRLQESLFAAKRGRSVPDTLIILQVSAAKCILDLCSCMTVCTSKARARIHHREAWQGRGLQAVAAGVQGPMQNSRMQPGPVLQSQEIRALGAQIFTVPRGGEITFHGPGQMVAYPILDIRALRLGARYVVHGGEVQWAVCACSDRETALPSPEGTREASSIHALWEYPLFIYSDREGSVVVFRTFLPFPYLSIGRAFVEGLEDTVIATLGADLVYFGSDCNTSLPLHASQCNSTLIRQARHSRSRPHQRGHGSVGG